MNSDPTTIKHRSGGAVMKRLEEIRKDHPGQTVEFTLDRACELIHSVNREDLVLSLAELVRDGRIKQVIRVVSPKTQGGIGDYESLNDVPHHTTDWRTGTEIEVTPDDLRVIYVVPGQK
jgi:hypothetical protein